MKTTLCTIPRNVFLPSSSSSSSSSSQFHYVLVSRLAFGTFVASFWFIFSEESATTARFIVSWKEKILLERQTPSGVCKYNRFEGCACRSPGVFSTRQTWILSGLIIGSSGIQLPSRIHRTRNRAACEQKGWSDRGVERGWAWEGEKALARCNWYRWYEENLVQCLDDAFIRSWQSPWKAQRQS